MMRIFKENCDLRENKIRISYFGGKPILVEVSGLLFNISYNDSIIIAEGNMPVIEIMEYNTNEYFSDEFVDIMKLYSEGIVSNIWSGIKGATKGATTRTWNQIKDKVRNTNLYKDFIKSYQDAKSKETTINDTRQIINQIGNLINYNIQEILKGNNINISGKNFPNGTNEIGTINLPNGSKLKISLTGIITQQPQQPQQSQQSRQSRQRQQLSS